MDASNGLVKYVDTRLLNDLLTETEFHLISPERMQHVVDELRRTITIFRYHLCLII